MQGISIYIDFSLEDFEEGFRRFFQPLRERFYQKFPAFEVKPQNAVFQLEYQDPCVIFTGSLSYGKKTFTARALFKEGLVQCECSCGGINDRFICHHIFFLLEVISRSTSEFQKSIEGKTRISNFENGYLSYLERKEVMTHLISFGEEKNLGKADSLGSMPVEALSTVAAEKTQQTREALILFLSKEGIFAKVAERRIGAQGKLLKSNQRFLRFRQIYKNPNPFHLKILSCMSFVPNSISSLSDDSVLEIGNFNAFFSEFANSDCLYWDEKNIPVKFGAPLSLSLQYEKIGIGRYRSRDPNQDFGNRPREFSFQLDSRDGSSGRQSFKFSLRETQVQFFTDFYFPLYSDLMGHSLLMYNYTLFPLESTLRAEKILQLYELLVRYDWSKAKPEEQQQIRERLFYYLLTKKIRVNESLFDKPISFHENKPKAIWSLSNYHWNYRFQLFFAYGEMRIPASSQEDFLLDREQTLLFQRDPAFEKKHEDIIDEAFTIGECVQSEQKIFDFSLEEVLYLVDQIFPKYASEVVLECDEKLFVKGKIKPTVKAFVYYRTEWFEAKMVGEINGEILSHEDLERLLNLRPKYMQINGEYFAVDDQELRKFMRLKDRLGAIKENQQLPIKDFDTLQTLRESQNTFFDQRTTDYLRKIDTFNQIEEYPLPTCLKGELRKYQVTGYNWLRFLEEYSLSGILADDMGLGKTVQTLALLLAFKERQPSLKALIVAPKSLLFNWELETRKFTPTLSTKIHHGTQRLKKDVLEKESDLVITTYATLRKDIEEFSKEKFDFVVLDEAQNIKNKTTQTFKELLKLQAQHKLALTGTPIENSLGDLKSIFDFLLPGFFGSDSDFFKQYSGDLESLSRKTKPLILRRKKEDVLKELPQKSVENFYVDMTQKQERIYKEYYKIARSQALKMISTEKDFRERRFEILTLLLRLRQISCHPKLVNENLDTLEMSGKMEALRELITGICAENHKVLIFSQFSKMLELIRQEFSEYEDKILMMTGKTQNRQQIIDEFKENPKIQIFLMTLKVGGVGLNLTEADYVIIFDPWWNPASEAQAIDRTHRIGQTKPVFVYRFIAKNTIEEKIVELQDKKRRIADEILAEGSFEEGSLTRNDLLALFSTEEG